MITQKDKEMTRFGIPRTHICPWVGKVTMAVSLFVFVWGCGGVPDASKPGDVWEPALKEIALAYSDDAVSRGIPLGHLGQVYSMRFDTAMVQANASEEDTIGVCIITEIVEGPGRYYRGEIYIEEGRTGNDLQRLMYHELTHCVYDQDHWGEPGDIMYPTIDDDTFTWDEARDRHFAELARRLK